MTERNDGKMTYDSLQFIANKRWAKGITLSANYTWVPRWTEDGANTGTGIGNAFVDDVSQQRNDGPYFSQRKHRVTASGVWELPWWRDQQERRSATCSAAGRSRRCTSSSPASRGTCRATSTSRPASI